MKNSFKVSISNAAKTNSTSERFQLSKQQRELNGDHHLDFIQTEECLRRDLVFSKLPVKEDVQQLFFIILAI